MHRRWSSSLLPKRFILTLISLLATLCLVAAESYPSPNDGEYLFVHDYAGVLSTSDRRALENLSEQIEDSVYVQIATVIMDSLSVDTDIDDYATGLFTAWGIGSKKTDGGVLLLCVMSSHDVVIRTGYGVEGALTDAACISIINKKIAPKFKEGDYYQGLEDALITIFRIMDGEFTAEDVASDEDEVDVVVVLVILGIIFILPLFLPKRYRSAYYAFLLDVVLSALLRGGGSSSGGGGGRSYGGGSTGGGGARGSW